MSALTIPVLTSGTVTLRPVRIRDAKPLERVLQANRSWLVRWEATHPGGPLAFDARVSIRNLLSHARLGNGLPFLVEVEEQLVGQLNVSSLAFGSLSSAAIGYWVAQQWAGRGITPTAVALATDHCFQRLGLHRIEICIRPENTPSQRVVEKLGFRYEGLRKRYIHINGEWRDHFCYALTTEEVRDGVLRRWHEGRVPVGVSVVPDVDRIAAEYSVT